MTIDRITKYPGLVKELDAFLKLRGLQTNGCGSIESDETGLKTLYLTPEGGYGGSYGSELGKQILNLVAERFEIKRLVLNGTIYSK